MRLSPEKCIRNVLGPIFQSPENLMQLLTLFAYVVAHDENRLPGPARSDHSVLEWNIIILKKHDKYQGELHYCNCMSKYT
jgi:hypothetical protein